MLPRISSWSVSTMPAWEDTVTQDTPQNIEKLRCTKTSFPTAMIETSSFLEVPFELFREILQYLNNEEYHNFLQACQAYAATHPLRVESTEETISILIRYFGSFKEVDEKFTAEVSKEWHCIQALNLEDLPVTDDDLATIVHAFPRLRNLNLHGCSLITDGGLQHIAKLEELQILNLTFCNQITDAGLQELATCKDLRHVYLYGCHMITDASLKIFSSFLKELQILNLRACPHITDSGLNTLTNLQQLQFLNISGCGYTLNGYESLRKALPDLQIGVG